MHRAHSARAVVAHVLSQRSLSPPQQSHQSGSPSRASASADTAAGAASGVAATAAERPLPEQSHSIALKAAAADSRDTGAKAAADKPHVKRKLLNGMHTGSTSPQHVGKNGNRHPVSQMGTASADTQLLPSLTKPSKQFVTASSLANIQTDAAAPLPAALLAADNGSAGPSTVAEYRNPPSQQQQPQQQADKGPGQMNGVAVQKAGPGAVKAFLNGMQPNLATWDDVNPGLAKEHAALTR